MKDGTASQTNEHLNEEELPDALPLITLSNQVVFPMSVVPVRVTQKRDHQLVDDAVMGDRLVALLTRLPETRDGSSSGGESSQEERPLLERAYGIGVIGRILQLQHLPDGSINAAVQAVRRFRAKGLKQEDPYPVVHIELLKDLPADNGKTAALTGTVKTQMDRLITLSPNIPDNARNIIESIENAGFLADLVAGNLDLPIEEKQEILETLNQHERLKRLTYILARELEMLELTHKIQSDVKSSIDKGQREYFLRQQLQAIREELGETEEERPELREYREKLEALQAPPEVKKEAFRELERLAHMSEAAAEYHIIATYLDWIVELPWSESTEDVLDLPRAEAVLNEDHYGLTKVKRRILEYLAVRKLKDDAAGPILCFMGPPGVGKTSLGQSIARAMGRRFIRMSLGGMRDEAEIRGHRKTYVGALPGRIIQNIRKAGSNNPVFMLDEIDKVGSDFRGDPSSALLEVLDPAQNDSFTDLYLNVPFDLSKVMFIATGNMLDTIPWALRDRMEIIEIPGYTLAEKMEIAKTYLVPRQLQAHGLKRSKVKFHKSALKGIIENHTREAGVRNLEREIANVARGCARLFAEGRTEPMTIKPADLAGYLGPQKVFHDVAERTKVPGVATGLAWTPTGGDILFVEATRMPGKGNLVLTGQLGEVMKESAQAVLSYVRTHAAELGLTETDFNTYDIHIHVPAGAVPKDGPSAGVAILAAVVSLLTGVRVRHGLAMTGEITLRGLVLQVGGVKEKVLAAVQAGVKEIILPERCRKDLDEVPESAKKKRTFHFVQEMREVVAIALGIEMPAPGGSGRNPASKTAGKRA